MGWACLGLGMSMQWYPSPLLTPSSGHHMYSLEAGGTHTTGYNSTQSSLDKHKYTHKEMPFVCVACGDRFPFQSRLDQYMIKHVPNKLSCPIKSCSKSFKGQGDLNRHICTHKKGEWHHCAHCNYKNKDKRNVSSHMRVHIPKGKEPYVCTKCVKGFVLVLSTGGT